MCCGKRERPPGSPSVGQANRPLVWSMLSVESLPWRMRAPGSPIEQKMFDALRVVASYEYGFEIGAKRSRFGDYVEIELQAPIEDVGHVDLVVFASLDLTLNRETLGLKRWRRFWRNKKLQELARLRLGRGRQCDG